MKSFEFDYKLISHFVKTKSTVLDLGCGKGNLMEFLIKEKEVFVHGIEISEACIYKCVEKGLSVFHGDIENGLADFPDKSFDYVILYQSLQQIKNLSFALREALRVGRKVIVCFPNFAYIQARNALFFKGLAPVTKNLPYRWYNSPNLHFFSIKDFQIFCKNNNFTVINEFFLTKKRLKKFVPNLFAERAIFLIKENDT
ncbi:MAG: methionine biosynthesis protein MetW [Elusimicrobiota bacterium]|jgi:methionine biosynthesis protein MetW|nr:methionine biosynthesis protein MetW [Elusimicrobiota bacterium]